MNYYQYKRRVPAERRGSDYLKPFIFIVLFIAIIFGAWKLLGFIFSGDSSSSEQKVLLELESGSAKAMTADASEWKSVPSNIYLYEKEKVRTQSDGRLTLTYFDQTIARLDKSSEVEFTTMGQEDDSSTIELTVNDGRVWINNSEVTGSQDLSVMTKNFIAHGEIGSIFAIDAPDSLYVLKGRVQADILKDGEIIKTTNVGVGQQLLLTESLISDLAEGLNKEFLFALDDAFKTSNWYRWNQQKEGGLIGGTDENETGTEDETGGEENTDQEGDEDNTENATDDEENQDAENEEEDQTDETAQLTTPKITKPGSNGAKVTLDSTEAVIYGTVSEATAKVTVNGYALSKYVAGSTSFSYNARVSLGNLKAGDNLFTVVAVDKEGNKSQAASITLVLPQSVVGETEDTNNEEEESAGTGEVKITSPNGGSDLKTSETSFVISGTVPSNTAKVVVNGYQLKGYTAGSTTFKYNATAQLGTLEVGKTNTYTVRAYDSKDAVIGTDTMNIEVTGTASDPDAPAPTEEPAGLTLSISMPTTAANYQTTLNEVVLGGTVDATVENLYVNGIKLDSFAPGTGEWKMSVQLKPGTNAYSVYGEKAGVKTNTDSITITYQN